MMREANPLRASFVGVCAMIVAYGCNPVASVVVENDLAVNCARFVGYNGILSENEVTVCTKARSGTVVATVPAGSGVVLTPSVAIGTEIGKDGSTRCPADGGVGIFHWVGTQDRVLWTFAYEGSKSTVVHSVPMKGAPVDLRITEVSGWTDPADAGSSDSGAAPAQAALVDVQASLSRRRFDTADACDRGDLGTPDGPSDAGDAATPEAGDAGSIYEPLRNTNVTVRVGGGGTPASVTFTTDTNGVGFFAFRAPAGATTANLVFDVGGVIAKPVKIVRNPP
jgi:hypothetical protein